MALVQNPTLQYQGIDQIVVYVPVHFKKFMPYLVLTEQLLSQGYQRVERDDRLLDILPTHTREKGIELWEKNESDQVIILRFSLPPDTKKITAHAIPHSRLTKSLQNNTPLLLEEFQLSQPLLSLDNIHNINIQRH